MKKLEDYVRSIPDFPEPGIIFRDITSILQDADGLRLAIDSMQELLKGVDFDVIVGAESRGFVFGAPIAVSSFTMAQQMGGDDKLAGQLVVFSSIFSIGTMFLLIFLLKELAFL